MRLRKLDLKDAPLMLEWMHDESVVHDLRTDFASKTIKDCIFFIVSSQNSNSDLHLAIADEKNEYMGTVSLKHISNHTAEFGITVRKCAMGKGYSHFAMKEILKYGKERLDINFIYWCVAPNNYRAVRFYDKHGYRRIQTPEEAQSYTEKEKSELIWYKA